MKTKIFIIWISVVAFFQLTSCKEDFLDKKDPQNLTTDAYWKTENDLFLGMTSVYATLSFDYMYGTFEYQWVPTAFRGDDFMNTSPWFGWKNMENFTLTNEYVEISEFWNMNYRAIAQANQVLEKIDEVKTIAGSMINSPEKWKAEARFLRAFSYLNLLRSFRNPVFTDHFAKTESDYFMSQPDKSVIWKLVEEDLTYAMQNLPATRTENNATFDNVGRATSAAAAAYLGQAYLYQNKYSNAVGVLNDIKTGKYGTYSLISDFGKNFDGSMENNKESLFEIMYGFNPIKKSRTTHSIGGAFYDRECWPSTWIFNEMKSELNKNGGYDTRLLATIFCNLPGSTSNQFNESYGDKYAGEISSAEADPANNPVLFTDVNGNKVRFNLLSYNKYQQSESLMVDGWRNVNNIVYMRYSNVLLMLSEAENELNGPTSLAYAGINEVRARANMAALPTGLTKEQFRARIMHERAVEFAGENTRFYDLVRWDANGFIDLKAYLLSHGKDASNFTKGKNEYLPIPYSEISTNPKIEESKRW